VLDIADRAGLAVRPAEDIRIALWEKYTLLVAFSAMTGTVRLPIGAIRESAAATEMLRMLMAEVWAVGRAEGVALADALVDRQMGLLLSQDPAGTTSLYHDLVGGHRMELEALQGTAIRLARRHGIATPALDAAYAILQPWAMLNERAAVEPTPVAT
jgi:2-dehydropantoate 2-reductase